MRKRNKTSKQEKIRKNCQKEYEKYHSVKHASSILKCDEHTIKKYYKEFEQQEPVETNLGFIQTQRSVKNRVLPRAKTKSHFPSLLFGVCQMSR